MPRLIWSPSALDDVQQMYRFLAAKNLDAAKRAVKAIREGSSSGILKSGDPLKTWSRNSGNG